MSVVLRCPTCGTTQGRAGECEACAEGEVRYFCTNHDEGIWLVGSVCSRCGAKFGDAPRKPPTPQPPSAPTRPGRGADFRPVSPPRRRERAPEPDFGLGSARPPERDEPAGREVLPGAPSLGDLLEEIATESARARGRHEAEVPWAGPPARFPGFPLAGCLIRIVGLVFLLLTIAIIFLFMLFGGFIIR